MKGYIYISGTGTDPGAHGNLNDPVFSPNASLGACMPNIRRSVELGDYIFVISGSTKGFRQYVVGGFKVAEKINALAAHRRFPENRLHIDVKGRLMGNIVVDGRGAKHPLDRHEAATFKRRIENFIVGSDPVVLETPSQVERGRTETMDRLSLILERQPANRVVDMMGRFAKLNERQVEQTLEWLRGIKSES